jgi:hypothetical protein
MAGPAEGRRGSEEGRGGLGVGGGGRGYGREVEEVSGERWGMLWESGRGHREGLEGLVGGRRGSEEGRGDPGVGGGFMEKVDKVW